MKGRVSYERAPLCRYIYTSPHPHCNIILFIFLYIYYSIYNLLPYMDFYIVFQVFWDISPGRTPRWTELG